MFNEVKDILESLEPLNLYSEPCTPFLFLNRTSNDRWNLESLVLEVSSIVHVDEFKDFYIILSMHLIPRYLFL